MKNYPEAAVISPDSPEEIVSALSSIDIRTIKVPRCERVSYPVSGHPDIQMSVVDGIAVVRPDMEKEFLSLLEPFCGVTLGASRLSQTYPGDVPYNVCLAGNLAFHLEKATDPVLKEVLSEKGIVLRHVNQGYSRCSCLAGNGFMITADKGIYNDATEAGLDALKINPGDVDLPGMKYGFIGGASGQFGDIIFLTGNLKGHADKKKIKRFLKTKNKKIVFLSEKRLLDIGTMFFF